MAGLIIAFAYIRNRIGEAGDPCGRPALKGLGVSLKPSKQKDKVLSDVKAKRLDPPPAPKKSFLDGASNGLARTIAQIRTGHWLCAPYLKRTRKNRDDEVSDRCWWCGQWRMSRTHVFLGCMHPV
jgi:hypothetical protein